MAQAEDTELRDLVIEALEKNGSLAKIRALLRANIFLAFEDDYKNIKQNVSLDNVLKVPEGAFALSIIHEFLEYCNLKNTLFVYKSESRQEKEYKYEGQKSLREKLGIKYGDTREPALISIIKNYFKSHHKHFMDKNLHNSVRNDNGDMNYKDDQNCTYIVHEDSSSSTSNSQYENSSDDKTKLHLRLQLDNSDTDTSSDSTRDKSSSEYIPSEHIIKDNGENNQPNDLNTPVLAENHKNDTIHIHNKENTMPFFLSELKIANNSSSDSTSYVELRPFNTTDGKLFQKQDVTNTQGLKTNEISPHSIQEISAKGQKNCVDEHKFASASATEHSSSLTSNKNENGSENDNEKQSEKLTQELSGKSGTETGEYSYDFTMSGASKNKDVVDNIPQSPKSIKDEIAENQNKVFNSCESPHENSQSSRSSISISDVADLISEKSLSVSHSNDVSNKRTKMKSPQSPKSGKSPSIKSPSNDSGDFSESPVPSLSNLSLDIHSD